MPFSSVRRRAAITLIAGIAGFCALGVSGAEEAVAAGSLDRAFRILAGKTFVDLTHGFGPDTPVWPGFGQAAMTPAVDPKTHKPYTIAKDGFRATFYRMVGQYGTHIDPPAHFAENGVTMDRIPVKKMILRLVVLDDTPYLAIGHESMDADITDKMESETYILQHGRYQIEVMANLDRVPATGALIVAAWPKVLDGLGFPTRAFAILP